MRHLIIAIVTAVPFLAGCVDTNTTAPSSTKPTTASAPAAPSNRGNLAAQRIAAGNPNLIVASRGSSHYRAALARVKPVAEAECRARGVRECDFAFLEDINPKAPVNAFQTRDGNQPVVIVTRSLLNQVKDPHQIAFIISHETSHHIRNHLPRQQRNSQAGGLLGAILASQIGVNVNDGARIGGFLGSRGYSQSFELEADSLGAAIAHRAGYDPVKGIQFFARGGNSRQQIFATHPPDAKRIENVERVAAGL